MGESNSGDVPAMPAVAVSAAVGAHSFAAWPWQRSDIRTQTAVSVQVHSSHALAECPVFLDENLNFSFSSARAWPGAFPPLSPQPALLLRVGKEPPRAAAGVAPPTLAITRAHHFRPSPAPTSSPARQVLQSPFRWSLALFAEPSAPLPCAVLIHWPFARLSSITSFPRRPRSPGHHRSGIRSFSNPAGFSSNGHLRSGRPLFLHRPFPTIARSAQATAATRRPVDINHNKVTWSST